MRRKFLAVAMVATLFTSTVIPNSIVRAEVNQSIAASELPDTKEGHEKQSLANRKVSTDAFKADEKVTIIVELKDSSLLDKFNEDTEFDSSTYDSNAISTYLTSEDANEAAVDMLKDQSLVMKKINKLSGKNTSDVKVLYNYTAVLNGFAVTAKYSMLDKIKALPEVKNAYVGTSYLLEDPAMTSSNEMINSTETWDLNYQGEGMVVAVLDTGLDYNHEAFQSEGLTSPRITIEQVEEAKNSSTPIANGNYVSTKIPFSYDYADDDNDVLPSLEAVEKNGNDHGTHVAGTVAASGSAIKGVAPQAQLLIMKVFSDEIGDTGADTEDILAGLEDAVKLGADVINMSLGSFSGYSVGEEEGVQEVYDSIAEAGINLATSAGNKYSVSDNNEAGGSFTSNPDTSVVGSPSTYAAATSVASLINTNYYSSYFVVDGNKITYSESAAGAQPKLGNLVQSGKEQDYEFVVVPNVGTAADYENVDVAGKIAVVKRGQITFNEKVVQAKAASASAIIIYNNQAGENISMQIDDYEIPAVFISQTDGQILEQTASQTMIVSNEVGNFPSDSGYKMSDFSSWGVTPDLKLKPEITAPGENIYSTLPYNDSYGTMSGTSMASPHIAGTFALIKQYIKSNNVLSVTDESGKYSDLANQLLMSTAKPVKTEDGTYYSPRKQGSGLVNVFHAVTTGAYAYVEDEEINNRPKLDLLDSDTGVFQAEFKVQSVTGAALTYTINTATLTEQAEEGYILEEPKDISSDVSVQTLVNGVETDVVTVEPGENATVQVTITLEETAKEYINSNFVNGEFVDGFIFLSSADNSVDLTLPFMGYYGDWTKAPIMDSSSIYDNYYYSSGDKDLYQQTASLLYGEDGYTLLGVNPYDSLAYTLIGGGYSVYDYSSYYQKILPLDINKIAISPNGDGYYDEFDTAQISLLRNARILNSRIKNSKGEVVAEYTEEFAIKSSYYQDAILPTYHTMDWAPTTVTNNETFTYTISGILDYSGEQNNLKNSMTFPITIDTETPLLSRLSVSKEAGKTLANIEVKDNQYVAFAGIYGYNNVLGEEIDGSLLNESTKGTVSKLSFDITDYVKTGATNFAVVVCDYAGNEKVFVCTTRGKIITGNTSNDNGGSGNSGSGTSTSTSNEKTSSIISISAVTNASSISITLDNIKAAIDNKEIQTIQVVVTTNDSAQSISLTADVLSAIHKAGKDITVVLKDKAGNVIGTWKFKADMLKNITKFENIELFSSVSSLKTAKEAETVIVKALENNEADGIYINIAEEGALLTQGTYTASLSSVSKAAKGTKLYIYKVNKETGKLETFTKCFSYSVSSEGNVTFDLLEGGEYLVLTKKVSYNNVTTLKNQIKLNVESKTLTVGKTTSVAAVLPRSLQVVSNLSDNTKSSAIGAASISYSSSNNQVAVVGKSGVIKGKKAGTVTITAKVTLFNGTSKTFKFKMKVQ